jgi:4-alpha-glucanotransferase
MSDSPRSALAELARLHGVQTRYTDVEGNVQTASDEALVAVLQARGIPMRSIDDAAEALRVGTLGAWRRRTPPVAVAWSGRDLEIVLRLPRVEAKGRARCTLTLEDGTSRTWRVDIAHLETVETAEVEGIEYVATRITLAGPAIPLGYHDLTVEVGPVAQDTRVIAAPPEAHHPGGDAPERTWGLFAPLYALHSEKSWGAGDLSDLRRLMDLGEPLGVNTFATLPLLSTFLGEGGLYAHSPYTPVSRLYWNEMYVDPTLVPELSASSEAQAVLASGEFEAELSRLRAEKLVDYAAVMALKRRVLAPMAEHLFASGGERRDAFEAFLANRPGVEDYARFRATCEKREAVWRVWPEKARRGSLVEADWDEAARRYHLFAQWVMHDQLSDLAERARRDGDGLYLDLPVGVHPDGYDTWREHAAFALASSTGAPPDPFFTLGQDWGFPPLDPDGSRDQGHRYFISIVQNHLAYAGTLRIDHVMGLHRLFWVPRGFGAKEGVYVRYPADELYAVMCLESHRAKARIVGENLGTVPDYVNEALQARHFQGMYVGQFAVSTKPEEGLLPPAPGALASLNTHDTPTFAAFWRGEDIVMRETLGLLDAQQAQDERWIRGEQRAAARAWLKGRGLLQDGLEPESDAETFAVLRGFLEALGESDAGGVLASLEDLWLEPDPQNVPGTYREYPNWQRKMRHRLEEIFGMAGALDLLGRINRRRKRQET